MFNWCWPWKKAQYEKRIKELSAELSRERESKFLAYGCVNTATRRIGVLSRSVDALIVELRRDRQYVPPPAKFVPLPPIPDEASTLIPSSMDMEDAE
jgi:hypothetical protein